MLDSVIAQELLEGKGLYLAQAAKLLPRHRQNRPVSPSTLFRWIKTGILLGNGERLHLEAAQIAGRYATTQAALMRFIERQSPVQAPMPSIRSPRQREKAQQQAAQKLQEKYGI